MNEDNIEHISRSTNAISEWSIEFLKNIGISDNWVKYINLIFLVSVVVVLVFVVQYVTRIILQTILSRSARLSKADILENLSKRRFPHFLAMIVPFSLAKGSIPIIFDQFPKTMRFMDKLADIYLIFYVIWLIMSVVNAFSDTLRTKPSLKDKPLDSYVQVVKIIFYIIGFIILFSILTGQNPTVIITGLGAASAILMLIFKDTILGFVASLQVSTNDMVRIGDWITMPKYGADGDVVQITLTTVKIRNFDKTITTIPPYSLVSDSFQNWRGMVDTGGRRLKRSVFIKQSTIRFIREEEIAGLEKIQYISDYIQKKAVEINEYNSRAGADKSLLINGRNLTNMGLYRHYIDNYLRNHPDVHKELLLIVRQLQPTSKGLPLELYFFTATIDWVRYEEIVSDVFDHITAAAGYFDLELYEDVSNPVIASLSVANSDGSQLLQ
ncbi:MAG: mechanosensitive ion channel protein MscS [Bacteroidetes bacterium GWD2_45_23]|jgi:miniconductance mechanosensitive channel|nr:mechanosensitive ion channel family protein [Porphyromonadaceae bacterium]OFX55574.1 MAG: mechanosensitive ion channel protein MscS [Bacteroidetes bacterium GWC2_46_850]OFX84720.1 MAG: mechanosensitive ion channel protein MscS [Bacteroidetes bacterium GWD2_45_23]HBB00559.1 mechanosensitive ion channel protein MscS [Porphyromonadaceae bacterium]HCC18300.1 mechanosensitive ion channel protein MscS [Porphyromonadaceae bacterium]